MDFIYRQIINGKEIPLPELQGQVEGQFPNHQNVLRNILVEQGVVCEKIAIHPCPHKIAFGAFFRAGRKCWIVLGASSREEMVTTLLHECIHYHHPELKGDEKAVETMALALYGRATSSYLEKVRKEKRR